MLKQEHDSCIIKCRNKKLFNRHAPTLVNTELLFELSDAATTRLSETAVPTVQASIKFRLFLDVLETLPTACLLQLVEISASPACSLSSFLNKLSL